MKHQLNEKNGKGNSPKALNKVTQQPEICKKKERNKKRHMSKKWKRERERMRPINKRTTMRPNSITRTEHEKGMKEKTEIEIKRKWKKKDDTKK